MPKRTLRIVKRFPNPLAVCERCNTQFSSAKEGKQSADTDIQAQFDGHKCKPLDSSQNALRIVREATENK